MNSVIIEEEIAQGLKWRPPFPVAATRTTQVGSVRSRPCQAWARQLQASPLSAKLRPAALADISCKIPVPSVWPGMLIMLQIRIGGLIYIVSIFITNSLISVSRET